MVEEKIINIREEIRRYAISQDDLLTSLTDNTNSENPARSNAIVEYVGDKIDVLNADINNTLNTDYLTKISANTNYLKKEDASEIYATIDNDFLNKEIADTYYAPVNHNHNNTNINMYANPIIDDTKTHINQFIESGYYQFENESPMVISCAPDDTIHYENGYIRVEEQDGHIIQHLYSTTDGHIDGREFIRYGYDTGSSNYDWGEWCVKYLPYKERSDLIIDESIPDDIDSFTIYENTSGYTFNWTQAGDRYQLPMEQYQFYTIASFRSLPIAEPYVIGNLIGHIDTKITQNSFKIRSVNKRGEYVTGVNNTFFIPRTN